MFSIFIDVAFQIRRQLRPSDKTKSFLYYYYYLKLGCLRALEHWQSQNTIKPRQWIKNPCLKVTYSGYWLRNEFAKDREFFLRKRHGRRVLGLSPTCVRYATVERDPNFRTVPALSPSPSPSPSSSFYLILAHPIRSGLKINHNQHQNHNDYILNGFFPKLPRLLGHHNTISKRIVNFHDGYIRWATALVWMNWIQSE